MTAVLVLCQCHGCVSSVQRSRSRERRGPHRSTGCPEEAIRRAAACPRRAVGRHADLGDRGRRSGDGEVPGPDEVPEAVEDRAGHGASRPAAAGGSGRRRSRRRPRRPAGGPGRRRPACGWVSSSTPQWIVTITRSASLLRGRGRRRPWRHVVAVGGPGMARGRHRVGVWVDHLVEPDDRDRPPVELEHGRRVRGARVLAGADRRDAVRPEVRHGVEQRLVGPKS